jgi:hypothetical protein
MKNLFCILSYVLLLSILLFGTAAVAGEADVLKVNYNKTGNTYRFDVTVLHADAGWDHYANKWDVVTEGGEILATRTLYHPHDNEQPFTRSISGVTISENIKKVILRAHDSVHGYGGKTVTVELE